MQSNFRLRDIVWVKTTQRFTTDDIQRIHDLCKATGIPDCHTFTLGTEGETLDARATCTIKAQSIDPHEIRVGRYGAFIQYGETGEAPG